ncbi:hypothetical protein OHU11_01595 [Streptomyces sp. NBC_00257]|uniref:hypothetical protein n=1 Tax=unclassified Streptomyces TaxID=2593676 RepID=UPI0022568D4E|nr:MULTISPECIES: hypothetical protein [unclassified Streptomyces]WTB59291.1 hypothetical protein OG832_42295 [Streptomyces sp. NBC_00826]WTH87837.1 hypothetical protein OIC43_01430 [Streptomyces sp. NBC_00825]WTH96564.1 hypothetical protein OHA23_01435 [Streptomyces sp. NBC_00822]MCX4870032.1 hypothetical protein [Streptomyces sp. NBC_00906]MCX4901195.1 hypothetical protein [Streptomyces sp. NBC_00892]
MTTNPAPEATTPGFAGTRLALARQAWGAVSVSRLLGLQAVERLGAAAGPTIMDRSAGTTRPVLAAAPTGHSPVPAPCSGYSSQSRDHAPRHGPTNPAIWHS